MKTTVAKAIIQHLEAEGIDQAFGISGSHFLTFFKALKDSGIKYISAKHETAAGFMALNYTKVAQKPALLLATAGPGAMNLLNGVAELYKAQIPAFIITPMIVSSNFGKNGIQEDTGWGYSYSINRLMENITRKSLFAHVPGVVPQLMQELFRFALLPPCGPVHMAIPSNYFDQELEYTPLKPEEYRLISNESSEVSKIKLVAEKIKTASNPVLLVGERCIFPAVKNELSELSHNFRLPVVVTINAKGLFDECSLLFGGVADAFGHRSADKLLKTADLILACGVAFHESTTLRYDPELFRNTCLIALDSNHLELGNNYKVSLSLVGNIKVSLRCLSACLQEQAYQNQLEPALFHETVKELNHVIYRQQNADSLPLKPQVVFYELSKCIPAGSTVISDIGAACFWALRNYVVHNTSFHVSLPGASMGQGVAGCIGARAALPDQPVFCFCGDGAFLMHGMEISTARQYSLGVIWIIFLDNKYNMVDISQKLFFGDIGYCTEIYVPDFAKLAAAFELEYFSIETREAIGPGIENAVLAAKNNISSLVCIRYDGNECLPLKPHAVKYIDDFESVANYKATDYFMKNFKNVLQEKV